METSVRQVLAAWRLILSGRYDAFWQDEGMRSLIHSLPTFPVTLATPQSTAATALDVIVSTNVYNRIWQASGNRGVRLRIHQTPESWKRRSLYPRTPWQRIDIHSWQEALEFSPICFYEQWG
jgi:hypothetical protein